MCVGGGHFGRDKTLHKVDQGKEFVNAINKQLFELAGIDQRLSSPK